MPQLRRDLQHKTMWHWAGAEMVLLLIGLIILVKVLFVSHDGTVKKIVVITPQQHPIAHIAIPAALPQAKTDK